MYSLSIDTDVIYVIYITRSIDTDVLPLFSTHFIFRCSKFTYASPCTTPHTTLKGCKHEELVFDSGQWKDGILTKNAIFVVLSVSHLSKIP